MLRLTCDIKVGEEHFDYVNSIQLVSSWRNLTDTATVKLPRNLITRNNLTLNDVIKIGQPVEIKLGYDLETKSRFVGYVEAIGAATNIMEIKCQDEMWKLKQGSITKSWKAASLSTVINEIEETYKATWKHEIIGEDVKLGNLTIENLSGAKLLQKLKSDYGICCFFRGDKLICGKPYDSSKQPREKAVFEYGENVISWKDLTYVSKADVAVKVKMINIKPDGSKEESNAGDEGGDERIYQFYNLEKTDLDKQAQAIIEQLKYDGYRGKLLAFGEPKVSHGDMAVIRDARVKEREGKYFIDGVETSFSTSGMRQVIELGQRISST